MLATHSHLTLSDHNNRDFSRDHMASFNYDGMKARDVTFPFGCYLSNIRPKSIFHESMEQGITWGLFSLSKFLLYFY